MDRHQPESLSDGSTACHNDEHKKPLKPSKLLLATLYFGAFLGTTDESFVLITSHHIAQDLGQASSAFWLITGYNLGYSIALPIYGRIYEILGQLKAFLLAYVLYAVGAAVMGSAKPLPVAIIGRLLAGLGGAGMVDLASVALNEMADLRQVAVLRSYLMACIVLGGLAGAPLGAFLTSVLGWRISFFLHIPLVFICAIITTFKLFAGSRASSKETGHRNEENCPKKPATDRPSLDMGGIITLTCTIVAFVLLIQLSTEYDLSGSHIGIPIGLGVALLVCATLFGIVEVKWASNPVIPFQLVKTTQVGQIWGATFFSSMANFVLASTISPYFVQTHELTTAQSGLSLIPQSVGATIGAILTGIIVKRTGRYKACAIIGLCVAIVSHVIIIVRWSVFEPFMWELIYTATAGFGATMSCSAQFVALSSAVSEKQITVAITSYYLFQQIGNMIGIALTQPLQRLLFEKLLGKKIGTDLEAAKTIKHILDNAQFSWSLPSTLHGVVNFCFRQSYLISPVLSIVALSSALLLLIKLKDTTV